jgi:hypothetical protein
VIISLLEKQAPRSNSTATGVDGYVIALLRAAGVSKVAVTRPPLDEVGEVKSRRLSIKELEILFMAGSGLLNRENGASTRYVKSRFCHPPVLGAHFSCLENASVVRESARLIK